MTEIRREHVEWAVVDRLRQMLIAPPDTVFNVTQTFALFSAILCWTLQHMRIPESGVATAGDQAAVNLRKALERQLIADDPWRINFVEGVVLGARIPAAPNFRGHAAMRFLKNLRDATAHGDTRTVEPFHASSRGADRALFGFSFKCAERDRQGAILWSGEITLLEEDMRRVGAAIAGLYCDAVSGSNAYFQDEARQQVRESAA
jgi:hypothetical protein